MRIFCISNRTKGFGLSPFSFLFPILSCFDFGVHFEIQIKQSKIVWKSDYNESPIIVQTVEVQISIGDSLLKKSNFIPLFPRHNW